MNNLINTLLFTAILSSFGFSDTVVTGEFIVEFPLIQPDKGMVEASLYHDSDKFLVKDQYLQKLRAEVVNGKARITFKNIPFGKVAVGSYHDVDADNTYDKTMFGLPKEPYAFSKKPVCNWRKPRFSEVAVDFQYSGQVIQMEFQTFME